MPSILPMLFGVVQTLASGETQRTSKGLLTSKSTAGAIVAALGWLSSHFHWSIAPDQIQPIIEGLMMAGGAVVSVLGIRSASLPFAWQVPAIPEKPVKGKRGGRRKPKATASDVPAVAGAEPAPRKRRATKAEMEARRAAEANPAPFQAADDAGEANSAV